MKINKLLVLLIPSLFLSCTETKGNNEPKEETSAPKLEGMLLFHSYTSYESNDSKMFVYDFNKDKLMTLSDKWNIKNPMNGSFSPDGKLITFMGIGATGTWDVFLYNLTNSNEPLNITADSSGRDEDPKFSFDGTTIIYKRNEQLIEYTIATNKTKILTPTKSGYSMPFYSINGEEILYSGSTDGTSSGSYIGLYSKKTGSDKILYNRTGVHEYYPITKDQESFYYSASYSETNKYDQIYLGYFTGLVPNRLPFNSPDADYSDAAPVNDNWVILSSTRKLGKGAYDLYIANIDDGSIYSLDKYHVGINTNLNELGACYNKNNVISNL